MRSFKRAVSVTLLFALCAGIVLVGFSEVYFNSNSYYYQDSEERENLAGSLNLLVCGGSQGLRAFVPTVLDEELGVSSYNLSGSLMTMKGRYTLLKKEIERNDINVVIIELSYNATTRNRKAEGPEGDIYVLGRLDGILERLEFFFSSMYIDEYDRIIYDTLDRGIYSIKSLIGFGMHYDQNAIKGYLPIESKDCTITVDEYLENFQTTMFDEEESEYNLKYLNLIAELCLEKNIRTVVVVTPLTDRYLYQRSNVDIVMNKHKQWAQKNGFEYYDLNLLKTKNALFDDTVAFFDDTHLSAASSITCTKEVSRILNEYENGIDVSEYFYSSYSEAEKNSKYRLAADS